MVTGIFDSHAHYNDRRFDLRVQGNGTGQFNWGEQDVVQAD